VLTAKRKMTPPAKRGKNKLKNRLKIGKEPKLASRRGSAKTLTASERAKIFFNLQRIRKAPLSKDPIFEIISKGLFGSHIWTSITIGFVKAKIENVIAKLKIKPT